MVCAQVQRWGEISQNMNPQGEKMEKSSRMEIAGTNAWTLELTWLFCKNFKLKSCTI